MIVLLIVTFFLLWLALRLTLRSRPVEAPFMLSHRGAAALSPENTIAGVSEGIRQGAEFIEVDVRRSADGALILMHDWNVARTTDGTGSIGELTWDEIGRLDAGSYFSPEFVGEPVPTLDSVLELMAQRDITLVVEAKDPRRYPGIEQQIAGSLRGFEASDRVVVVSFDHGWLREFHMIAPDIPLGEIWIWLGRSRENAPIELVCVHWASVLVDPTLISRAHSHGHKVVAWTVDTAWCMRLLLWLGVDGITTNRPDLWTTVQ